MHWGDDNKRHTSFRIASSQDDAVEKTGTTLDKVFSVQKQKTCLLTGESNFETVYKNHDLISQFYKSV